MIRKLRIKFTAAAAGAVFLVLAVVLTIINVMNYRQVLWDADTVLDILSEHQGRFPENLPRPPKAEEFHMSPEAPYESRYFSVELTTEGRVLETDTGKIAAIDENTARELGKTVLEKSISQGFAADYRYKKQVTGKGSILIIFLDCQRSLSTFRSFLLTSIFVSVLGIFAVCIFLILVSKRIVRPFAESYEKQKRFITDAGHEIKTPLTIIDADAAVMEMEEGENEWLQDIQKQTRRLKELTNDLIYLSKMEEGQGQMQKVEFPISELAQDMAESFQALAKAGNKTFQYHIEPMVSCCGEPKAIGRMLSVLLDNAMKYSDKNGRISFTLEKKGKNISIRVFNTATSVDREQLSHIFDRFYRMEQSRNSETGGYGIGLSIAKAVAEAHKGKITVSSEDGKSLTFHVIL